MSIKKYLEDKSLTQELKNMFAFHTTSINTFELIAESSLKPTKCKVFNQDLLYLFYGRSSYSKKSDNQISLEDNLFAASMGIEKSDLDEDEVYRIYPFDSGAFKSGKYSVHISNDEDIDDYLIPNDKINLYLQEFFGDENKYLNGEPFSMDYEIVDNKVKKLHKLLSDRNNTFFDTRARTIEILYKKNIELKSIKVIVIHERNQNKDVIKKLKKSGDVRILTYDSDETGNESDIYTLIRSKIKEFMKDYVRRVS